MPPTLPGNAAACRMRSQKTGRVCHFPHFPGSDQREARRSVGPRSARCRSVEFQTLGFCLFCRAEFSSALPITRSHARRCRILWVFSNCDDGHGGLDSLDSSATEVVRGKSPTAARGCSRRRRIRGPTARRTARHGLLAVPENVWLAWRRRHPTRRQTGMLKPSEADQLPQRETHGARSRRSDKRFLGD